jgi:hypothetical protein
MLQRDGLRGLPRPGATLQAFLGQPGNDVLRLRGAESGLRTEGGRQKTDGESPEGGRAFPAQGRGAASAYYVRAAIMCPPRHRVGRHGLSLWGARAEAQRARVIHERSKSWTSSCEERWRSAHASGDEALARRWWKSLREAQARLAKVEANLASVERRAWSEHVS